MILLFQLSLFLFIFSHYLINCRTDTSSNPKIDNPDSPAKGLFPNVFNLASGAIITVNATCGETGPEVYCKIAEHVYERSDTAAAQCNVCDAASPDPSKRHPIANAIDGTDAWWQSPTLQNGKKI
jgi:laminin alpha 1/2